MKKKNKTYKDERGSKICAIHLGYHDDPKQYVFYEGDTSAACSNEKSFQFDQGEFLTSFTLSTNGGVGGKWSDLGEDWDRNDLEKINGMEFTTSRGREFKLDGKACTASWEKKKLKNNNWSDA